MNINKNSWHYKLVTWNGNESAPRTLCPYFWKGVWNILIGFCVIFFVTFAGWGIGTDVAIWLFAKCGVALTAVAAIVPGIITGWFMLAAILGSIFGAGYGTAALLQIRKEKKQAAEWKAFKDGTYVAPEPNVLVAYIKARKAKYCPMLEFK